jgi:hypothetical protein
MYSSINSFAHRFNMYPLLQNTVYLFNSTFVKKTHYPIISICLFIIVIVLNSIQYANNENYLQDKILIPNNTLKSTDDTYSITTNSNINNILIYIYDLIGINGFIKNTPGYIFVFIFMYICVSLIELNIGHASLLFLLFITYTFRSFWSGFTKSICENNFIVQSIDTSRLCCSSDITCMSLGFILCLLLKNIKNIYSAIFIIFLIIIVFSSLLLYDYYIPDSTNKSANTYIILTRHGWYYIFGIISGLALGN